MATRLTSKRFFSTTRTMSMPRKFDFLVILPDKADALPRRLEARPSHMKGMVPHVKDGSWKLGGSLRIAPPPSREENRDKANARETEIGALLKSVPKDDDPSSLDFLGSALVVNAESKEEILEMLRNDVYAKADVWDFEKVQIYPFKSAWKTTSTI
ncbi:uncharacterized protein GMORB2_3441 [Geosmithia morbida]|uniref:YCII-related domain-containing protein n=1 Tax=Geosmithia morbida TaxID=1094350 RepID=A0A9P4YNX3_9HYPO|nr:uncharacterized protein GMORB2_3441 [Geosmithia morbida]KAF4120030.1 uncharacterized protein GMORB2_3441 [Geosmithia morbida]